MTSQLGANLELSSASLWLQLSVLSPMDVIHSDIVLDSFDDKFFEIPIFAWFCVLPFLFLLHTLYCIAKSVSPEKTILYSLLSFFIIVFWITLVCSILINLMELLQILTNMNSVFLGLTVLAWANSIGGNWYRIIDYFSITAFAKKAHASTAVAGCFSGQLFNFLLGFGISCVINSISG